MQSPPSRHRRHASAIPSAVPRRLLPALLVAVVARRPASRPPTRRGATVLFASGADLQSINPLLTLHPLARQVQRYVLLTTLARYDSRARAPSRTWRAPGAGRADRRTLTLHLHAGVRWHDGAPTTARDVRLDARRRARSGDRLSPAAELARARSGRRRRRLDRGAALRRAAAALPRRAHRPRHPAGAPARHRAARPAAAGGVERRAGRQRPVPVRGARAQPPLGLRRRPRLSRARWAARRGSSASSSWWWTSRPPSSPRSPRASSTSPASSRPTPSFVRARSRARGAELSAAAHLRHRVQHPAAPVRRARRAPRGRARRSTGGRSWTATSTASARRRRGPVPPGRARLSSGAAAPASASPRGRRAADRGSSCSRSAAARRRWSRWCRRGSPPPASTVTIRQLELSAFLARVYGPAHDFDAAVLGIPGDLGLGYLGPLAALAGLDGAGRIRRRRSASSPTRCRWRFSIMRADCRG